MSPRPVVQDIRSGLRLRILAAFEERARQDGPRAVVMAELARDLSISTRTLYQVFPSKAELVREMMEHWASKMAADQRARRRAHATVRERMRDAAESWIAGQDRFSKEFWIQVRRDFPEAAAVLDRQTEESLGIVREWVTPQVHGDLHAGLALILLVRALRQASDPGFCNHLGLSRQEAMNQAIELWCRGALRSPEAADASLGSD